MYGIYAVIKLFGKSSEIEYKVKAKKGILCFDNGDPISDFYCNGLYYQNGTPANGDINGKLYADGELANGVINGKFYVRYY